MILVAYMIVTNEELSDYVRFYLQSTDDGLMLSTLNVLTALYICVIKYKITVSMIS